MVEIIVTNSTVIGVDLAELILLGAKCLYVVDQANTQSAIDLGYESAANKNFHEISTVVIGEWCKQLDPLLPSKHKVMPATKLLSRDFLENYMVAWTGSTFMEVLKQLHKKDGLAGVACRLQNSWVLLDDKDRPLVCLEFCHTETFVLWGNTTGFTDPKNILEQDVTAVLIKWLAVNQAQGKPIVFKGPGNVGEKATADYKRLYDSRPLEALEVGKKRYNVLVRFSDPGPQFQDKKQQQFAAASSWLVANMPADQLQAIEVNLMGNIVNQDGVLVFEDELTPLVPGYTARLHGHILDFEKDLQPVLRVDTLDNTVIILSADPDTVALASKLGAKRFSIEPLSEEVEGYSPAFSRDRLVRLESCDKLPMLFRLSEGNMQSLACEYKGGPKAFYQRINMLLAGAEFTEGKQEEYARGLHETVGRFSQSAEVMDCVIGYDDEGQIACIMRMLYFTLSDGRKGVYLSDEAPDLAKEKYFPLLFSFVKNHLLTKFGLDTPVFMRVANGKEDFYELGSKCSKEKGAYVVHGPPTVLLNAISCYLMERASQLLANQIQYFRDHGSAKVGLSAGQFAEQKVVPDIPVGRDGVKQENKK